MLQVNFLINFSISPKGRMVLSWGFTPLLSFDTRSTPHAEIEKPKVGYGF